MKELQGLLSQGRNVALLTGGDPNIYSQAFLLLEGLDDRQVEVIPGIGAMSPALAALKRAGTGAGARFVLQTGSSSFFGPHDHDDLARHLAKYSGTMIFYMGLKDLAVLTSTFKKYHPPLSYRWPWCIMPEIPGEKSIARHPGHYCGSDGIRTGKVVGADRGGTMF